MSTTSAQGAPSPSWTARLHQALMPDYNRPAAIYWWAMAGLGLLAATIALAQLAHQPLDKQLQVTIGCLIASMAGFYPVRIPGSKNSFAAGESLHLPAAADAWPGSGGAGSSRRGLRRLDAQLQALDQPPGQPGAGCHRRHGHWLALLQLSIDHLWLKGWLSEAVLLLAAMAFAARLLPAQHRADHGDPAPEAPRADALERACSAISAGSASPTRPVR